MSRESYATKQRGLVEGVLRKSEGVHLTAAEIFDRLEDEGCPVGIATVYRCLDRLVVQGVVRKYTVPGTSACYEYVGANDTCASFPCFHLKCTSCGSLTHLSCDAMAQIAEHLASDHDFTIDLGRTVIYGICRECEQKA